MKKMLEKFTENDSFDAHFHYADCKKLGICSFPQNFGGISCAHSEDEWNVQNDAPKNIIKAYGMHPQNAQKEDIISSADYLENLVLQKKIAFIGEIGFDFFSEFRCFERKQEEMFNIQLDIAEKYGVPVVIHCRKAIFKLFEKSTVKKLSNLREVLFHSFMGSSIEAKSLLDRQINGFFSFGKQIFNGNKKVIECVKNLPLQRILAETDAPFQFLKGEKYTSPLEITKIFYGIKNIQKSK